MAEKNIYTVVVADDEEELRESVCAIIPWEALGYHLVGSAGNGLDALELVEQLEPDLLLTDIRMPFITGIELARQVREIRPSIQIAFLSGYDDFEYAKQAIQYNIISYMLKPLTLDGLAAELKVIHDKIDAQDAALRQRGPERADYAAFLIPLVLEAPEPQANATLREATLREFAAGCGLLRGADDRSALVVMQVRMGGYAAAAPSESAPETGVASPSLSRLVAQLANKYLRSFVFFCGDRAVAVLLGNVSDFEEYLRILADEICQVAQRALGRQCNIGVSRMVNQLGELNAAYRMAGEALRRAGEQEDGAGNVSFNTLQRVGGANSLCDRALEIVEQRYTDESLSLASLSAMLDVSPNHLSASIKKAAGETFINILIKKRMSAAQELLLNTDLQVQEIARRCGYSDQHYFSYCFKKYSGTSPNALRRKKAAGEPV